MLNHNFPNNKPAREASQEDASNLGSNCDTERIKVIDLQRNKKKKQRKKISLSDDRSKFRYWEEVKEKEEKVRKMEVIQQNWKTNLKIHSMTVVKKKLCLPLLCMLRSLANKKV